jgi:hypothetical protein
MVVVWVVGTLINLYRTRRRTDDDLVDQGDKWSRQEDRRRRQRALTEEKQRHMRDEIPPW